MTQKPEIIAMLIVSFSGKEARAFGVGGLFKVVATHPAFYEVELVKVHPAHPLHSLPVGKWVAGLTDAGGRLLLKRTMVHSFVDTLDEYDVLLTVVGRQHRDAKRIPKLIGLLDARLQRKLIAISRFMARVVLPSDAIFSEGGTLLLQAGKRYRLTCSTSPRLYSKIGRGVNDGVLTRHQLPNALARFHSITSGLDVEIIDPLGCEVRPLRPPTKFEVNHLFRVGDAARGKYYVKKSAKSVFVSLDRLAKCPLPLDIEEVVRCCENHFTVIKNLRYAHTDIGKARRELANVRAVFSALTIAMPQ